MAWRRVLQSVNAPKAGAAPYAMIGDAPTVVVFTGAARRIPPGLYRRAVFREIGGPWWVFAMDAAVAENVAEGYLYRYCAGAWVETDLNFTKGGVTTASPTVRSSMWLQGGFLHVAHGTMNEDAGADRYRAKRVTSQQCVGAPTFGGDILALSDDGSYGYIMCGIDFNGNGWLCCHYRPGGANGRVRVFRTTDFNTYTFSVDTDLASNSIMGTIVPIGGDDVFLIADTGGGNPLVWKSYIGGVWSAQATLINDFADNPTVTRRATDGRMFLLYESVANTLKLVGFDSDGVIDETATILADASAVTYCVVGSGSGKVFCLYLKGAGSIYGKYYQGGVVSDEYEVVPMPALGQVAINCSFTDDSEIGIVWEENNPPNRRIRFSKFPA